MSSKVVLRLATEADVKEMVAVQFSAFEDDAFNARCYPESDPESHRYQVDWLQKNLGHEESRIMVAEDAEEVEQQRRHPAEPPPPIMGWARWVRRTVPAASSSRDGGAAKSEAPIVFKAEQFPNGGDGAFAAQFYQANYDATQRIVGSVNHWFLSMLVVRKSFQRKGVGTELMRYGVDAADADGWPAYVNGSDDAKELYQRFGFRTVAKSQYDGGIRSHHMKREAAGGG